MDENSCYIKNLSDNNEKIKPDIKQAFDFYKTHLLNANKELDPLLRKYQFKSRIPSWKWELFAAILVGDVKKQGNGIDLLGHEVKAYQWKHSPEYQYHRKSWEEKLEEDKQAKHICIWYKEDLKDLDVFIVEGRDIAEVFESWRPEIHEAYETENPEKRCRKNLPKSIIEKEGILLFSIREAQVSKAPSFCNDKSDEEETLPAAPSDQI
jgi:hypothetical protein